MPTEYCQESDVATINYQGFSPSTITVKYKGFGYTFVGESYKGLNEITFSNVASYVIDQPDRYNLVRTFFKIQTQYWVWGRTFDSSYCSTNDAYVYTTALRRSDVLTGFKLIPVTQIRRSSPYTPYTEYMPVGLDNREFRTGSGDWCSSRRKKRADSF